MFFIKRPPKRRQNVTLTKPIYLNRHRDRDFLILGTGPTLNEYRDKIKGFARKENLIVIGVNYITPFTIPDYHGFVNRYRLHQYGPTINQEKSRALLSIYFTDELIKKRCKAPFDLIMWRNSKDAKECHIDPDGIITHHGTSVTLMIMVAYVMGARKIYVAGVEGFKKYLSSGTDSHYTHMPYKKHLSYEKMDAKYQHWPFIQKVTLDSIYRWALTKKRAPFIFITPGLYDKYYSSDLLRDTAVTGNGKDR